MKVGILTLPLHSNFGYLMQAYALQVVVKKLGHQPYTIYIKEEPTPYKRRVLNAVKRLIKNLVYKTDYKVLPYYPTASDYIYKDKNTWDFIKRHLSLSTYVNVDTKAGVEGICEYDAYIVGSDQVWRREYAGDVCFYFFDFLKRGQKRMSYAASFGNANPTYSKTLVSACKQLISSFDIVTVRESDGISICQRLFGIKAQQVLDPTLLLSKSDYELLIDNDVINIPKEKYIFAYILDSNPIKEQAISKFAEDKGYTVFRLLPRRLEDVGKAHIDECIYPPMSTWLQAFANAQYIITDSFHGTVFSILFHKQFSVFCNYKRGASRIESLLKDFNLDNRLMRDEKVTSEMIDYNLVEPVLQEKRKDSITILSSFLKESNECK